MGSPRTGFFQRSQSVTLKIAIFAIFALTMASAWIRASLPWEMNYEEGNMFNAAVRLLHGAAVYPAPGSFPYIVSPYGPVGYLLTALAVAANGVSLFGPRLLVLLAGVGICFLISALTKRFGGRWEIGFLFGTFYLCSPLSRMWLPILRVDLWAVCLTLLGLYLFTNPKLWQLAPLCLAIAVLTKHTVLAAPLASMLCLLIDRNFKKAAAFAAIFLGAILATFLFMGRNFTFYMFSTYPDPYSVKQYLRFYGSAFADLLLPIAVLAYGAAAGFRWLGRSRLGWLYLGAASLMTFTAGKLGSDSNHFLEWAAAVCIMAALALSYLLECMDGLAKPFTVGSLAGAAFFSVLFFKDVQSPWVHAGCSEAYSFVRTFPGDRILSEDVAALVLGGKPVLVSNPFATTQLDRFSPGSAGALERMVHDQYFDLILLGGDVEDFIPGSGRWSPELIEAVRLGYEPVRHFDCSPYLAVAYASRSPRNLPARIESPPQRAPLPAPADR